MDNQQLFNLILAQTGVITFLATIGLAALVLVLRQNKDQLTMIYHSASPETQKLIHDIVTGVKPVVDLAAEVVNTPGGTVTAKNETTQNVASAEIPVPNVKVDPPPYRTPDGTAVG